MQNFDHEQFIRDQVGTIPPQYQGQVTRLAQRLTSRDNRIVDTLREEARRLGLRDQARVDAILARAGLLVEEPLVAPNDLRVQAQGTVTPPDGDLGARLDALSETVNRLVRAAEQRGITV